MINIDLRQKGRDNMDKVKLTMTQAETLEKFKDSQQPSEIVADFLKETYTVVSPIYDLSLDTLIKALYIGYYLD